MNKYSIIGCVGEGSYGIVLKCREKDNGTFNHKIYVIIAGTFVAIKKFRSSDDDPIFVRTSVREVKILRTLRHPNIVRLQDVFKRYVMKPLPRAPALVTASYIWCLSSWTRTSSKFCMVTIRQDSNRIFYGQQFSRLFEGSNIATSCTSYIGT